MIKLKFLVRRALCITLAGMLSTSIFMDSVRAEQTKEDITTQSQMMNEEINNVTDERDVMALVYLCDYYDVKSKPSDDSDTVVRINAGHTVIITGCEISDDTIWYRVKASINDKEYEGYIEKEYLAYSDERLIGAEEKYMPQTRAVLADTYADIDAFPVSYQSALTTLKQSHPNWTFVPMNTGLNWSDVVNGQMYQDRSLVPASSPSSWIRGYYSNSWSLASEDIVKYYLDPRNYLNDTNIFAFEQLTYNASYHTETAVQGILQSTFMAGEIPNEGMYYCTAFYNIGATIGVSPFHLACRVYQEQGNGTSPLISGTYPGYEGLYNYFNIGASGSTNEAVYKSGLSKAREYGWTTRFSSLLGGAQVISSGYILKGQDTLYLQKFDVDASYNGLYSHQYMQNIMAPTSESSSIKKAYTNANSVDNLFVFKIPVYENMPATRCLKPGEEDPKITAIREFVTRLYTQVLGREPDQSGLDYWMGQLINKTSTGAQVAYGFVFGEEFAKKNYSDSQFLDIMYKTLFNRAADEGGKATWMDFLNQGVSREYVFKGYVDSTEFENLCTKYDIDKGTIALTKPQDQNAGVTFFVGRCYTKALGRKFDEEGLATWCTQILTKTYTPKMVAESFIFSDEFKAKNLSNQDYINVMYATFLDRNADEEGMNTWLTALNSGELSREQILAGFADSAEFTAIMAKYGLN
ncbi:MAG: DUF4214 domain-containing protein [Lachnospiraceae bacterium]